MAWSVIATLLLTVASGAVFAGAILLLGVLGGQWALRRQIIEARDAAELANNRINREIKTRAGREGVEARQDAKSLAVQAAEALAAAGPPGAAPSRFSPRSMINGGKK